MAGRVDYFEKAMREGHSLAWDQQWDEAAAFYRKALEEFPDESMALTSLGLALFELKRYDQALQVYQQAAKAAPNDPIPLENVGQLFERLGNNQEAVHSFLKAAELYVRRRDTDKALTNWTRVTRLDPDNITAHSYLAVVHERLGHDHQAAAEYLLTAGLLQRSGNAQKAVDIVSRSLRLDPDSSEARQAQILLQRGQLLPKPIPPQGGVTQPLLSQVEQKESPKIADTGLDPVEEAQEHALTRLAGILFDLSDGVGKIQTPKLGMQAIARGGKEQDTKQRDRFNVLRYLGKAINEQSNNQETQAAEDLEKAMAAGFTDPALSYDLGLLLLKNGQLESALPHLQKAVIQPDYALGAHLLLAQVQRKKDRLTEAASESLQALKEADALVVPPEQADGIRQLYEPLIEAQAQQTDAAVMHQLCENVSDLLARPDWRSALLLAREQLPKPVDGMPPIPLAEILAHAQSSSVLESIGRVHTLSRAGHLRAAMDEAFESIKNAPNFLPLHTLMGDLLMQEGRMQDAVTKYLVVAEAYRIRGEAAQAVTLLHRILQASPMDMSVRNKLVDILASNGMIDEAINEDIELASIYYRLADLDMARKTYESALTLARQEGANPTWASKLMRRIVDIDMQRMDMRQALAIYEELRKLEPEDVTIHKNLIEINIHLAQIPQAADELKGFLGYLQGTGRRGEAIPFLEELVKENPKQGILRQALAEEYRQAERISDAVAQMDALGNLLLNDGDREGATRAIEAIIALNPPNRNEYQSLLAKIKTGP